MKELVLITGSSSGIGESIARRCAANGAQILLTGRSEERLAHVQKAIPNSLRFTGDLSDSKDIEALAGFVEQRLKTHDQRLVGLVNNAGIVIRKDFNQSTDEEWQRQFVINLFAPVTLTRRLFSILKNAAPASVLNISSTLGLHPIRETSAYSASKAAMINWTQTLALEWAPYQIRVNCLCPGLVDTPIHDFHRLPENSSEKHKAHTLQPLARMGRPEDIAEAAEFLLSNRSSWTTGSVLSVDGGIHLL